MSDIPEKLLLFPFRVKMYKIVAETTLKRHTVYNRYIG